MTSLTILTWHVHGSYLRYLAYAPHRFLVPVTRDRGPGYGGRCGPFDWPDNVIEIDAAEVRHARFDIVLCQSRANWETDRALLLSQAQLELPSIYLEHDPPRASPTDTLHPVQDGRATVVHVTPFNAMMWDNGTAPVHVIEHGVPDLGALWTGESRRGLTVVNGLAGRGRRLGADIYARAADRLPIDLVGMESAAMGGLGEVPLNDLPAFAASYRFFFHPIRWTSLGLALCEAMMMGMPVVAIAATAVPDIIEDGISGYASTDEGTLHEAMRALLDDHDLARRFGAAGREVARQRFGIKRFAADWSQVFADVAADRRVAA